MPERVLWVLRHAKTLRQPPPGGDDHDRALSQRGRADADALGRRLGDDGDRLGLDEGILPELVLCSTATRAVDTTERVLAGISDPPPVRYLRSLYGASPEQVLEEVARVGDSTGSVLVVGHNPSFEALAAAMARSTVPALGSGFATCALAVFEVPVASWTGVKPRIADVLGVFRPPY